MGYGEEGEESQKSESREKSKGGEEPKEDSALALRKDRSLGNQWHRTEARKGMKLQGYRDTYYTYTGKVSDVCRPMALAGIAVLWIFKTESGGQFSVPQQLVWPGLLIIGSLAADLLQYMVGSVIWFLFYRWEEYKGKGEDVELTHSIWLEAPIHLFFWTKAILLAWAYYDIVHFFFQHVSFK